MSTDIGVIILSGLVQMPGPGGRRGGQAMLLRGVLRVSEHVGVAGGDERLVGDLARGERVHRGKPLLLAWA